MCLAYLSNICIGALGYQKWVSDSLELELQTVVSHHAYILNSKPESSGITKKKSSWLLSHLSTHSLYTWVDGNIIYNSQRSKKKPKTPRIHLLGNGRIKYDILMQQNITQPREERQCVPEAKYLVRLDGVWELR